MQVLWGIGGMVALLAIAFGLSTNRRAINPRTVFVALAIQVVLGVVVLYWEAGKRALEAASNAVQAVIDSSNEGIEFLFGPVLPEEGLVFAFQVLPVIIFFAALTSVLYHWHILQWVVKLIGGALQIALTVGAMLIAFISLIALVDIILGAVGGLFGFPDLTFELILGYVFAPIAFVIGVPWGEAVDAGSFFGQKLVLNEFVAFSNFGSQVEQFSQKTVAIVTFGLTGFANFGSIAILIGTFGSISPGRRHEVAQFGIRAVLAGTLANLMNATIAGILIG